MPVGCGDGIVESGEICDDGNLVSGDGCSGDCKSDETCGNGYLDAVAGEQCDIGTPGLSNDGCSSVCTVEVLDWQNIAPPVVTPVISPSMAFDSARGVMVSFGGGTSLADHTGIAETWEYGGTNWYSRRPPRSPPAPVMGGSVGSPAAFDAHRRRVVMLDRNVTWEYDGRTWSPGVAPPADGPFAFDAQRGAIVMFDGTNTWTYDGSAWTPISTTSNPPSAPVAMTRSPVGGCEWVFSSNEGWKLCGSTWTRISTWTTGPALDSRVVFSGTCNCAVYFDGTTTWHFNGATWTARSIAHPDVGLGWAIANDELRDRVVLFGGAGTGNETGHPLNATWEYDGNAWQEQTRATESAPASGALVFDPLLGRTLAFQGTDFWELDSVSWRRHETVHPAPIAAMAYDAALGLVIAFDGSTWEFDGMDWAPRATAHAPAAQDYAMGYDSKRGRIVMLVGGRVDTGTTWEFDGNDWIESTGVQPTPRVYQSLGFDSQRGRLVMFGGSQLRGLARFDLNDTWEYDGHDWHDVTPAGASPSLREGSLFAYDPRRARLVLFGGARVVHEPVSSTTLLADTWEWDGAGWTPLLTATRPPAGGSAAAFDSTRSRIVASMTGGSTWELSYASAAAPADICNPGLDSDGDGLIGCDDPDCAGYCTPGCPPGTPATSCSPDQPHCGDRVCNGWIEPGLCPADCP